MSTTTMNSLAYDTFEPGLNGQIEQEASIYQLFEKSARDVEGRTAKIKLLTGDSLGVANITEGGDYPAAGDPTSAEASITLAEIAATLEFTTLEAALLRSRTAAAEDVVMLKMENLKTTVRRDLVRQGWMDGSAKLARTTAAAGVNVIPIASTTTNQVDRDRGIWLGAGRMNIDVVDATTGAAIANGTGRTITAVDFTTGSSTVTVSGAANLTPTANTVITRAGAVSSFSSGTYVSGEFPGIFGIINATNTYLGINRSTAANAFWRASVLSNSGTLRSLSMPLVMQLRSELAKQGSQPTAPDWCFMANQGVWNSYGELLTPQVRYQAMSDGLQNMDGGWAKLDIFGAPFYEDIHAPRSNLFAIYKPGIGWRRAANARRNVFQFQDEDGSVFRMKPGVNAGRYAGAYQAHLDGFAAIVSPRPNVMGRLDDLVETGTVN